MKFNYMKALIFIVLSFAGMKASAQQLTNQAATATWAFDKGASGQVATFTPTGSDAYFKNSYEQHGSNLTIVGAKTIAGITETAYQPSAQDASASETNAINWMIAPKNGLTFTPTKVSVQSTRFGTDAGTLDFTWVNSDGTTVSLATAQKPERDKNGNKYTQFSYDVTGATASSGICGLRINLYSLGNTKQIGFANVIIEGTLSGTVVEVKQCKLALNVSPDGAGTVSVLPVGTQFDQNTELTLSETRNFGYKFKNWTDASGNELSTAESFKYTLADDATITANYEKVNTYALTYKANDGAKSYMINLSPAPTDVNDQHMYEEGTVVTMTASSNKIFTFNNWSTGETSSQISVTMSKDQEVSANYSYIDFIAGWDFYVKGNNGRVADFAATDNDADALVMRTADGTISGWLDKSTEASPGGYEGRAAAVNWSTVGLGKTYWQTMVNASAFTGIKVSSAMLYNYNAYTKYDVEYSLNSTDWTKIGTVEMTGVKTWADTEFALPSAADNQSAVYIRWIADATSTIAGTTSNNDGISITDIYVTGTKAIVDDGKAPVLQSTVPVAGSATASANGKIVLTFNEKVKTADGTAATLDGKSLEPDVSGKSILFEYKGLKYATQYTFTLPANSVSDLSGNTLTDAITLTFTTMTRPTVTKAMYDFIVPDDGTFKEAIAAAAKRTDTSKRFRIFIKQGAYTIPADATSTITGSDNVAYPNPITTLNTPNVSIIGEDMDETSIVNTVPTTLVTSQYGNVNAIEGLGKCETMSLGSGATDTYIQDLTIKNGLADNTGRGAALEDGSNRTICKNTYLYGYQDTYLSNNSSSRFYFEDGILRGRTDFLCGKGDVFYNGTELLVCAAGGYIAAPSVPTQYGYIFKDCTIKGEGEGIDGNFTLGRPWGSGTPIALYIDTKMEVAPSAAGWNEMSGGWPSRMAEYNSTTSAGTTIDLSNRKTTFASTHTNNPILTADEAAAVSLYTVMGGSDDWNPTAATEQASAPENVTLSTTTLSWADNNYVLCWAICKDGKVVNFTTATTYTVDDVTAKWSVRAANEMGGLGEATEASAATGISNIGNAATSSIKYYNLQGMRVNSNAGGAVIKVETLDNGSTKVTKIVRK